MVPYFLPVSFNSNMHIPTPNNGLYLQRNYLGDYHSNEPAPQNNTPYAEPAIENYIGNYYFDGSTTKNCAGGYQLLDRAIQNYFGDYYPAMRNDKEQYLDEVLRNAPHNKMKSLSTVESALASNPVQRSYLRSLKRKKLRSFMVRDLIDLPAEENSPDTCDANNNQDLSPSTPLTPSPEPEDPWKKQGFLYSGDARPCDTTGGNRSESLSQDAMSTFVNYLANKFEPSHSDTTELTYKNPTKYCHDFVSSEPSDRTPSPPVSLGSNSDISSTSPCGKAKRVRTIFTCSQLERLEMEFERTHYMVGSERSQLASELNLSESQVKVWFQNRRIKQRKQFHERQQAMLSKLKESQKMDSTFESEKHTSKDNSISSTGSEESSLKRSSDLC